MEKLFGLGAPALRRARTLYNEGRVYRRVHKGKSHEALVLSDLQPESVSLEIHDHRLQWECSCSDSEPCAHVLALLSAMAVEGLLDDQLTEALEPPPWQPKKKQHKASSKNMGHFSQEQLFSPEELQPELFSFASENPKKPPVHRHNPSETKVREPVPAPPLARSETIEEGKPLLPRDAEVKTYAARYQLEFKSVGTTTEIQLTIRYGSVVLRNPEPTRYQKIPATGSYLIRDLEGEREFRDKLRERFGPDLAWERGPYAARAGNMGADWAVNQSLSDFLVETGSQLIDEGYDILIEGKRILGSAQLKLDCSPKLDWFDVKASVELPKGEGNHGQSLALVQGADRQEIPSLVATDQGYVSLGKDDLRRLAYLKKLGMDGDGQLHAPRVNLNLVEALYDGVQEPDQDLEESKKALEEIESLLEQAYGPDDGPPSPGLASNPLPTSLKAQLRSYQIQGYHWLRAHHKYRFGACLADDMGLGKTMQTLALLCSLKESGQLGPSLLIAPVVTLSNWEAEISAFAPDLSFVRHRGQRRAQDSAYLRSFDLVVVSYQTLRNDLDLFADHSWDYIILDEAHYIKSAQSQIFKAVRVLNGTHRLSLTGTPLENNSGELWAQFSFLNPGLLGTRLEFQEQFAQPIERHSDQEAAQLLRDTVRPFILRRKKQEVLSELPEKNEQVYWVDMESRQAELYHAHRKTYQELILGLIDRQGIDKSRIEVFKYLLRLRQLAIAPALVSPDWALVSSGKMEALLLMLRDLVDEDNKVLIFSQFTKTLKLIGSRLEENQWKYSLLTGQTQDRQKVIDQFKKEEERKIFLLSLKAGGVGINLTQANYVVLFDPWWNPAAENQAVDRVYRMGQRRNVTAYRFISRGTIEEKILALQERKSLIQEALVSPEASALARLDEAQMMDLFSE